MLALAQAVSAGPPYVNRSADLVAIDVGDLGAPRVDALRDHKDVLWSAEFGTELLLALPSIEQAQALIATTTAKHGPFRAWRMLDGRAAPGEIVWRNHECGGHAEDAPVWAVVGGYGLIKVSAAQAQVQLLHDHSLLRLSDVANTRRGDARHFIVAQTVKNLDQPIAPMGSAPGVSDVVARVDANRWFDSMSALAAFNRNSYNPALLNARDWIRDRFAEAGLATSDFQFPMSNTGCSPAPPALTLPNIIGQKAGLTNEWIVVGAHYDSRNTTRCDFSETPQPGANDNASGCAGVIELARVFQGLTTRRGILFMCFSGEEQNLRGSENYVDSLVSSGEIANIKSMLNLDMIGHDMDGTLPARINTRSAHQALANQYAAAAATYAPELRVIVSTGADPFTDHIPFLDANTPAVHTWENGATGYSGYHTVNDLPTTMTRPREMAGGILKMNAAMLYVLADVNPALFANGFE